MSSEGDIVDIFEKAFREKSFEGLNPYLAEDMTYELLPSTVGSKMTKAEWKEEIGRLFKAVGSVKLERTNTIKHPLFVVVQVDVTLAFPGEEFTQGILLLFNFSKEKESGALKLASVTEYVDSFKVKEFKAKLAGSKQPSQ